MASDDESDEKGHKTTRAFPKNTLKDALRLAESIQNNNAVSLTADWTSQIHWITNPIVASFER